MANDEHLGRWGTVRYAIDDWNRTLRLCLILFVASSPFSAVAFIVVHLLTQR